MFSGNGMVQEAGGGRTGAGGGRGGGGGFAHQFDRLGRTLLRHRIDVNEGITFRLGRVAEGTVEDGEQPSKRECLDAIRVVPPSPVQHVGERALDLGPVLTK